MLEHTRRAFGARFDHPLLAFLFVVAGLLAGAGAIVQLLTDSGVIDWAMGAAFLGVFGLFTAGVAGIAYGLLFLAKTVSRGRDRFGPTG